MIWPSGDVPLNLDGLAAMGTAAFLAGTQMMPRYFQAGPVMLDLFHRDGNVGGHWLSLHPREFELFWRLAESAGQRLSCLRLLADVWRISDDPGTKRVEVCVARVRAKLHVHGLSWLIATASAGGYMLEADAAPVLRDGGSAPKQHLDSYLRIGNDGCTRQAIGDANATPPE